MSAWRSNKQQRLANSGMQKWNEQNLGECADKDKQQEETFSGKPSIADV